MAGDLFILSAPSGAGKTTIIQGLLERQLVDPSSVAFSVSHTTREPRPGEVDGQDYHFVDRSTFDEMIADDEFLEWAEVHGNHYGTSANGVLGHLRAGRDVLLDIDVKGALQVLERHPEAVGIFVMPPSYAVLRSRLQGRNLDAPEAVERRLKVSLWEIRRYHLYEYVIINDDAVKASEALAAILLARRQRGPRVVTQAARIARGFEKEFEDQPPE